MREYGGKLDFLNHDKKHIILVKVNSVLCSSCAS